MGVGKDSRPKIVVLGAGFGGLNCALDLDRRLGTERVEVVLVDRHPYHLLTPALYLAGAAETANRAVCIPLSEILSASGVRFHRGTVGSIDRDKREIMLDDGPMRYDTVVVALGNHTDYFGIPGLRERAIPFKEIYDAGRLRHALQEALAKRRTEPVRIIVGGGGFTGSELAGEMAPALKLSALGRDVTAQITIIEAGPRLLPTLRPAVSKRVMARLDSQNIAIRVNSMIKSANDDSVELSTGERLDYDILLWTGGVSGRDNEMIPGATRDRKGNYLVDRWLSLPDDGCFVLGDMAVFMDPENGKPVPATAQTAIDQGRYLAANLALLHNNREPRPYRPRRTGYLIPVIRRYAVIDLKSPIQAVIAGRAAFYAFEFLMLEYLLSILPAPRAWRHWRGWLQALSEAESKLSRTPNSRAKRKDDDEPRERAA